MHFCSAIAVLPLLAGVLAAGVFAQSSIPGKFDVFNHNPVLLRGVDKENELSNKVFSLGSNRAPLHDTPASKCKCSACRSSPAREILTKSLFYLFQSKDAARGTTKVES